MNKILELKNVTIKNKKFKLENINFALEKGYVYGLVGKNGAGKSTLLKSIYFENWPYKGDALFSGFDIKKNRRSVINKIGYISEDFYFIDDRSMAENARLFSMAYSDFDKEIWEEMTKKLGINLNTNYMDYSRGEKIKAQLAFAFAHKVELLIMDEASAGLDAVFKKEMYDLIREGLVDGLTVLLTSHDYEEIKRNTDFFAVIKDGVFGEFKENVEEKGYEYF